MIKSRAITSYKGILSRVGITAQIGIGGGGGSSGSLFDGTYAFYPFATDGNNTVTAGVKINERLSDKNFFNDAGSLVTVGEYETAYTGSGELDEPSATNLLLESNNLAEWGDAGNLPMQVVGVSDMWRLSRDGTGRSYIREFFAIPQEEVVASIFVEKETSRYVSIRMQGAFPARCDLIFDFDMETFPRCSVSGGWANPNCGFDKTSNGYRIYISAIPSIAESAQFSITFSETEITIDGTETSNVSGLAGKAQIQSGKYPDSYIPTTTAPETRDSDKAAVPTSDVYIDSNHELTESGGIVSLAGTKYDGLLNNKIVGAYFVDANQIKAEITTYSSNELTVNGSIESTVLAIHYSTLTLAETTQLRADVGDTPPTEFPDGSFRWLDWPAENVAFEIDFTMLSDEPNELCHIEWTNAPKDTYAARIANNLEFNHGNDTLTIPYANLIVLGDTYKGYAVITATELIGFVNGVEVARMTRTDTALAEWSSKCYLGGFNDTLAPVKLAKLKVLNYVAPPPIGNLIVSNTSSLTGDSDSTGYAASSFTGGSEIGSLNPPASIGGVLLDGIYSNNSDIGDGTKKYIFMVDVGGLLEGRVNATFNGVTYEFDSLSGAGSPPGIQSDVLYDFLLANRDIPIVFTAEVA